MTTSYRTAALLASGAAALLCASHAYAKYSEEWISASAMAHERTPATQSAQPARHVAPAKPAKPVKLDELAKPDEVVKPAIAKHAKPASKTAAKAASIQAAQADDPIAAFAHVSTSAKRR